MTINRNTTIRKVTQLLAQHNPDIPTRMLEAVALETADTMKKEGMAFRHDELAIRSEQTLNHYIAISETVRILRQETGMQDVTPQTRLDDIKIDAVLQARIERVLAERFETAADVIEALIKDLIENRTVYGLGAAINDIWGAEVVRSN